MTTNNETYEGWSNRETWCANVVTTDFSNRHETAHDELGRCRDDLEALTAAALLTLETLNHLTSEEFAMGKDREARRALVEALNRQGLIDAETLRDYRKDVAR